MLVPRKILGLLSTGLLILPTIVVSNADAANTSTLVTLTVASGSANLQISQPVSATLSSSFASASSTGLLGTVTVTDSRGTSTVWAVSALSTSFNTTPTASVIPASGVAYASGIISVTGTGTVTNSNQTSLATSVAVVTSAAAVNIVAAWNPTITVAIPAGTGAGTYTGTITQSVY